MKCIMRVYGLTDKKVSGLLFKVENDDRKVDISFKFDPSVYNDLLKGIQRNMLVEVQEGVIVSANVIDDKINPNFVALLNPMQIIEIILKSKKVKKKQTFYKKYCELAKCCQKTAQTHLQRAISDGVVIEEDYYTIKLRG